MCSGNMGTTQTALYGVWWPYKLNKHKMEEIHCGAVGSGTVSTFV